MYDMTVMTNNTESVKTFDDYYIFDLLKACQIDSLNETELVIYRMPQRSAKYVGEQVPVNHFDFLQGKLQTSSKMQSNLLEMRLSEVHQSKFNVGHAWDGLSLYAEHDGMQWKVRMNYHFGKKYSFIYWYNDIPRFGRGMKNPPKYFLKAVDLFTVKMKECQAWFDEYGEKYE